MKISAPRHAGTAHTLRTQYKGREKCLFGPITVLVLFLIHLPAARGHVTITLVEAGDDVIITASGSLNLSGLTRQGSTFSHLAKIDPDDADFSLGAEVGGAAVDIGDTYRANDGESIAHPSNLGPGRRTSANSGSGALVGFSRGGGPAPDLIQVPDGYTSGSPISASATFNNTTIADLGLSPGDYTWSWGTGATADSITMNVPDTSGGQVTFAQLHPTLDPDADENTNGVSNYIEYAAGFDPSVFVSPSLVPPSIGSDLSLTLRQRNNASDVFVGLQKSPSLLSGSWTAMVSGSNYVMTSSTPNGDQDIIVLQLLFDPDTDTKMFFRQTFNSTP